MQHSTSTIQNITRVLRSVQVKSIRLFGMFAYCNTKLTAPVWHMLCMLCMLDEPNITASNSVRLLELHAALTELHAALWCVCLCASECQCSSGTMTHDSPYGSHLHT